MKGRKYSIELSIDPEDGIIEAKCSCPRGQVICHHMAAVCIHAHHNISVTDKACSWNAPKQTGADDIKTLGEMFPMKNAGYKALMRPANEAVVEKFKQNLNRHLVGFSWLLPKEPEEKLLYLVPNIEDILESQEYISSNDKREYLENKCRLTESQINSVTKATIGQACNENWLVIRKYRLTASHFGSVLSACKRKRFPPSLFKSLLEGYNLNSVVAIQWGRENEATAVGVFEEALKIKVSSTGLWLQECGYLGASPDGLVGDDAVIEIKCPYKYCNTSLQMAVRNDKSYIIFKNEEGVTEVNEKHHYWDQIQGQLHLTKRKKCYLVVWTPSECEIVEIARAEEWGANIAVLKSFYLNNFITFVTNS